MNSQIAISSAAAPLGGLSGNRLFKIASGPYAGRMIALFFDSSSQLSFSWSDAPYIAWATPTAVASDLYAGSYDAVMAADGSVIAVYTQSGTADLLSRKLTFTGGLWSAGAAVVVHDADQNYEPAIAIDASGVLWVSWSRLVVPNRTVYVKSSSDGGQTWGTGPSDSGTSTGISATFMASRLVGTASTMHLVVSSGGTLLAHFTRVVGGGSWSALIPVSSGIAIGSDFDLAAASDGRIGVTWRDGSLFYREFDGFVWGAVSTIDTDASLSPQLIFRGTTPYLLWLRPWEGYQHVLMQTDRRTGVFSIPVPRDTRAKALDSVMLYDASVGSYQDKTTQAESASSGDVLHSGSGTLLADVGDALYAGMNDRFRYLQLSLSTVGVGGSLTYAYLNGSAWQVFTPASGLHQFDAADCRIVMWSDYASIPADWQRSIINGYARYWIRLQVTSAFAVAPIASRVSAISELSQLAVRR